MFKQKLFTSLLTIFMLVGSSATIWAMRANPPANLDHVVMGNISGTLVEVAVDTGNEALVTDHPAEVPSNFFAISQERDDNLIDESGLSILQPFTSNNADQP